ncbi:hypothetical protein K435DRAFT_793108 [Dendrothele bispora CBS 962.96]|uniref:Uncharacterized protein n=1 Tax=Dendrothele bispora (strain CBS 962.96) TaxID=1314807 RepID=A0A4S8MGW7_DENBC|nr:hypothetical protein K435DRAFT_793108 [Dendrothele bispora CBS 962.96]
MSSLYPLFDEVNPWSDVASPMMGEAEYTSKPEIFDAAVNLDEVIESRSGILGDSFVHPLQPLSTYSIAPDARVLFKNPMDNKQLLFKKPNGKVYSNFLKMLPHRLSISQKGDYFHEVPKLDPDGANWADFKDNWLYAAYAAEIGHLVEAKFQPPEEPELGTGRGANAAYDNELRAFRAYKLLENQCRVFLVQKPPDAVELLYK